MVKGRRKVQGATTVSGKSTTPIRIEVLDVDEAGYLIGWTAGETKVEDPAQAADPLTKAMVDLAKDTTIVFQLDPDTKLQGVRNWRQLQTMAQKVVDMSLQGMKKSGADEAALAKVRQQLLSMFTTRQQVEALFTRSSQVFFAPSARSTSPAAPWSTRTGCPIPWAANLSPRAASFTLEKVDATSDTAVVTWRQEIDPVAGAGILEKTLKDLAARLGKPVPPGKILDFVNIKDEASFTLHLSSGWPQRLTHTRTTVIAGVSQEDSLTFTETGR